MITSVTYIHPTFTSALFNDPNLDGSVLRPTTNFCGQNTFDAVKRKLPSPKTTCQISTVCHNQWYYQQLTSSSKNDVCPLHILRTVGIPVPHPYCHTTRPEGDTKTLTEGTYQPLSVRLHRLSLTQDRFGSHPNSCCGPHACAITVDSLDCSLIAAEEEEVQNKLGHPQYAHTHIPRWLALAPRGAASPTPGG